MHGLLEALDRGGAASGVTSEGAHVWAAFSAVAARRAPALARLARPVDQPRPDLPVFSWRVAQKDALKALSLLHPMLEDRARALILDGRVDAAARAGKPAQPFSLLTPDGPWVSLDWAGDAQSAATLAHELGHASAQAVRPGPAPVRALDEAFALMAETAFHAVRFGEAGARAHRRQHGVDFLIRQTALAWCEREGLSWPVAMARAAPHLAPGAAPAQRPGGAPAYALAAAAGLVLWSRIASSRPSAARAGTSRRTRAYEIPDRGFATSGMTTKARHAAQQTYLKAVMHAHTLKDLLAAFGLMPDAAFFETAFDAAEDFCA
jgi:hypothetical protein